MQTLLLKERQLLIHRMNQEMSSIANSPTYEVEKFRLALLAMLGGELKTLNDKIQWRLSHEQKAS